MAVQEQAYQVAVRITSRESKQIQDLVKAGLYRSSADFLREALRDKLKELESIGVTQASAEEAERLIESYLEKNPGPHFASDIADAVGLEYRLVFESVKRLLDNGRIRKAER